MAARSDPTREFHTYGGGAAADIGHGGPSHHAGKHPPFGFSLDSALGHHSIPRDLDVTYRERVIGHFRHFLIEACVNVILERRAERGSESESPSEGNCD